MTIIEEVQPKEVLPKDREHYVLDNLHFVDYMMQKHANIRPWNKYYDDYQQEGRYGLIKAAIAFDESRGTAFTSFAGQYIMGYVKRFRREFVHGRVKYTKNILDMIPKITNLYYEGYTYLEIQSKLNMSSEEVADVIYALTEPSLEDILPFGNDGDSVRLIDMIGSPDSNIADSVGEDLVNSGIEYVAQTWEDKGYNSELRINIWYEYAYATMFGEKITATKLADKYKISRAWSSKIIKDGKELLKEYLERYG